MNVVLRITSSPILIGPNTLSYLEYLRVLDDKSEKGPGRNHSAEPHQRAVGRYVNMRLAPNPRLIQPTLQLVVENIRLAR